MTPEELDESVTTGVGTTLYRAPEVAEANDGYVTPNTLSHLHQHTDTASPLHHQLRR